MIRLKFLQLSEPNAKAKTQAVAMKIEHHRKKYAQFMSDQTKSKEGQKKDAPKATDGSKAVKQIYPCTIALEHLFCVCVICQLLCKDVLNKE